MVQALFFEFKLVLNDLCRHVCAYGLGLHLFGDKLAVFIEALSTSILLLIGLLVNILRLHGVALGAHLVLQLLRRLNCYAGRRLALLRLVRFVARGRALVLRRLPLICIHGLNDVSEGALHDDELDLLVIRFAREDYLRLYVAVAGTPRLSRI